jgi:GT2 family glycosyltransferase
MKATPIQAMRLEPASTRTDVSDFWRPRLVAVLDAPPLSAGLYRFRIRTRQPTYATLRLVLDGRPAPMTVFLDRIDDCDYAKSFSVPRPVARIELEIEPHLDAGVILSAELEPVGLGKLLARRRGILRHLASPRASMLKLRQVIAGRSGLAFAATTSLDPQSIYDAWQVAFEGEAERRRIMTELSQLKGRRPLKLLIVASGAGGEVVTRLPATSLPHSHVSVELLEVGAKLPSLSTILNAAEEAGAFAFAIRDRPGQWSSLAPAMIAIEMLRHPDCVAVYGDSDRMGEIGRRIEPHFKPAWSPRYQRTADYVRSAVAFRVGPVLRELSACTDAPEVTSLGLLNALADAGHRPGAVRHVPRVLFHVSDGTRAYKTVSAMPRVDIATHTSRPSVSIIMPSRDNARLLQAAARSVLDEPASDLELIVVDNGSKSRSQLVLLNELARDPRVRVISDPSPFNFSALINRGAAASRGEVLLLLNDDVYAEARDWLAPLIEVAAEASVGCVGALLLYPSGRIQHAGVVLGTFGVAGHAFRHLAPDAPAAAARLAAVHEVSAVTAACLAVRRTVFDAVGGFDEKLPITLNDVDFCLRVRDRGYANLMAPHVRLVHHESASRGLDVTPEQAERLASETAYFLSKWGPDVLSDPFYSPHLTLTREDGSPRDI